MKKKTRYSLAMLIHLAFYTSQPLQATAAEPIPPDNSRSDPVHENALVVTAAEQNLQAPGVSTITRSELKKHPPARDIAEIIRTMPGVNLTGNATSGQRGNNRQIDIRGMGPENTLILIDGRPVTSRNSVRLGWRGERDTRGDTSWVPPEMIERIDIIRGPAAARYGNGAAGGVINLITRPASQAWHGSWDSYFNVPQHKSEGATKRTNFSLSGPLDDNLSFRLWGNLNKTQADAQYINAGHQSLRTGSYAQAIPAGREGVINKDINGLLRWEFARMQSLELEAGNSRQGNRYAGDTQNTNTSTLVNHEYGKETNRLYRQNYALTWQGAWDNGISTQNWLYYENTQNSRMNEGLAGGTEGIFSDSGFSDIALDDRFLHSEISIPVDDQVSQTITLGTEWNQQKMKDSISNSQVLSAGAIPGMTTGERSPYSSADIFSLFAEDNIELTSQTRLTPGLRFNHHDRVGANWSPSLNLSQGLTDDLTLKLGIAQAYKAPSLYQINPNYILYSRGQGCADSAGACYLMGNEGIKAETSINKELGLEYKHAGYQVGVTWFRNDYRNKIEAGYTPFTRSATGAADVYQWENIPKAIVEGIESTINIPVTDSVNWRNNLTWMLQSKNKETGDRLSVIPRYTLNSTLSWQATQAIALQSTFTGYGRQKPKLYNYKGESVSGSERNEISPYVLLGLSGSWTLNKNISVTTGIDNLLDKRHFRAGNAQTTGNSATNAWMYGAGAATYNESGRTFYLSLNTHF